jgi:Uma2 family endonuclease
MTLTCDTLGSTWTGTNRPTTLISGPFARGMGREDALEMTGATPEVDWTAHSPAFTMGQMAAAAFDARSLPHVRAPVPLVFKDAQSMPTGNEHWEMCVFLYALLRHALGPGHSFGGDQFVYWVPTNPRRTRSPDVFVKLGVPHRQFRVWKCWERGAPDLAIEIVSQFDADPATWDERLADYTAMGVSELVRFDREAPVGARLRAWDRVDGDFVERVVEHDETPCVTLGLVWVVRDVEEVGEVIRLARTNGELVPTAVEAEAERVRLAREERRVADEERRIADEGRLVAEARVRELEELLRGRG